MWNWFKRRRDSAPPPQDLARARAARRAQQARSEQTTEPMSLEALEANEGNTQADWSAWEDSMAMLDSQMGNLHGAQIYERESDSRFTRPSPLAGDIDVFGKVNKNREI